jgi:hypothetical protein
MPFAGYRDHADCVSKNRDKRDPDAYCAEVERRSKDLRELVEVSIRIWQLSAGVLRKNGSAGVAAGLEAAAQSLRDVLADLDGGRITR